LDFDPFEKYGGVGASPDISNGYIVVMQHPVTNEYQDSRKHINETLHAIKDLEFPVLWFWPNVDAGADGTSAGIRAFREKYQTSHIHFFKNMEGEDFLKLLYNSKCLVGNSSVGIRECAYLGVPVVNIGSRQNKRARGFNVVDVGYEREAIAIAVKHFIHNGRPEPSHVYGGGDAGKKIAALLAELPFRFHKTIQY
jgi:UDP-N-acetylglucosamine 2-epimerase